MHKNLLFLTLLCSCSALITSQEQQQLIKKNIQFKDINNLANLNKYIDQKPENNELATLAFMITYPDVGPKIFEYLIDEQKNLEQIEQAIKNNMDWQTVNKTIRIVELYQSLQAKDVHKQYNIKINPDWLKNYRDNKRNNLLHTTCKREILQAFDISSYEKRQSCIIHELCRNNVDVNTLNECNIISLHYATYNNNSTAVILLCAHHADVNAIDFQGNTPLHYAAYNHNITAAKILLNHNAKTDILNHSCKFAQDKIKHNDIKSLFKTNKADCKKQQKLKTAIVKELQDQFNKNLLTPHQITVNKKSCTTCTIS